MRERNRMEQKIRERKERGGKGRGEKTVSRN